MNDEILVQKTLTGDQNAFAKLVQRYQAEMYALAYRIVGNSQDAQERVQDAFLKAYQKLAQLEDASNFRSWLRTITANECRSWLRRQNIDTVPINEVDDMTADEAGADVLLEREEMQAAIMRAIESLSPKNRQVIESFYIEGRSYDEISNRLGISINAVAARLHKSRRQLQLRLRYLLGGLVAWFPRTKFGRFWKEISQMLRVALKSKLFPISVVSLVVVIGVIIAFTSDKGERVSSFTSIIEEQGKSVFSIGRGRPFSIVYSPDGKYLASATTSGLYIHDAQTLRDIKFIPVYQDGYEVRENGQVLGVGERVPVFSADFSHDGTRIIFATGKGIVSWAIDGETDIKQFELNFRDINSQLPFPMAVVKVSPTGQIAVGGENGKIYLLDDIPPANRREIQAHDGCIFSLQFNYDGKQLSSACRDRTAKIWDVQTQDLIRSLQLPAKPYVEEVSLVFNSDWTRMATAKFMRVKLWDTSTSEGIPEEIPLEDNRRMSGYVGLTVTPDGRQFVTAEQDGLVEFRDFATGKCVKTLAVLKYEANWTPSVTFAPDESTFAVIVPEYSIRVYDGNSLEPVRQMRSFVGYCANFSYDGKLLAIGGRTASFQDDEEFQDGPGCVIIWDVEEERIVKRLIGHKKRINQVYFEPEGQLLASLSQDELYIWDIQTAKPIEFIADIAGLSFCREGIFDITALPNMGFQIKKMQMAYRSPSGDKQVESAETFAFVMGKDIQLFVYTPQGERGKILHGHPWYVGELVLSPDGRWLVSISDDHLEDGRMLLWDIERALSDEYSESKARMIR